MVLNNLIRILPGKTTYQKGNIRKGNEASEHARQLADLYLLFFCVDVTIAVLVTINQLIISCLNKEDLLLFRGCCCSMS